jgi:FKBP-type peptidyl-prolyl cis-trans isomerase FklB
MKNLRKVFFYCTLALAAFILSSCGSKPNYKVSLKTETDSASYYIGHIYGGSMAQNGIDELNVDAIAKGWQDALNKVELKEEQNEIDMFMRRYIDNVQKRAAEKNLQEGQEFLEANKKKQGIVTLPSGLQYRIVKEGSGIKAAKEDDVNVVYHGTLINGDVFDSSKDHGDTVKFNVGGVVAGFSEALTLMPEGSVWEVYIPSELGYGERPNPKIKANSVLIFEIDLVKVFKNEETEEE